MIGRYGLLGPNGAGKSTLMRNIANGAIDGLPTELRTVFVEHDIVGSEVRTTSYKYRLSNYVEDTRALAVSGVVKARNPSVLFC